MRILFVIFLFLSNAIILEAQELICQVEVLTPQVQASDKTIYETLKTSIRDFMNNRKWTNDQYQSQERIECSIQITISERISSDQFKGNIQIQSRRPVYRTSYSSPVFNHLDNDFTFSYLQDQVLEFDESSNRFNLTSVLAYYAYVIIGIDYDTFSPEGGQLYFQKAQNIVNNAQSIPDKGWKAFENDKNRYWLTENFLNVTFKPVRTCLYKYHRLGLDLMSEQTASARDTITKSLRDLRKVNQSNPGSFLMKVFFNSKADEIVNIYSGAPDDEKAQIVPVLNQIDPGNISKYQTILTPTGK